MKKVILIASIAIVLLSAKANAQTIVSANCKTVKLTSAQVTWLHKFNNPVVDSALKNSISIKNNATADLILSLLATYKPVKKDSAQAIAKH